MKPIALLTSLIALAACGDGNPFGNDTVPPAGTATVVNGIYTVEQGDVTVELDEEDAISIGGQQVWLEPGDRAQSYESDSVLAIGGTREDGSPFAGISGTVRDAPTGDATFEGSFAVLSGTDTYRSGDLTLNYDLETGAITNDGGDLTVDATATELGISGSVEFDGQGADLLGNFFGTDEIAGAFTGDEIGGILYGTQQ